MSLPPCVALCVISGENVVIDWNFANVQCLKFIIKTTTYNFKSHCNNIKLQLKEMATVHLITSKFVVIVNVVAELLFMIVGHALMFQLIVLLPNNHTQLQLK